LASPLFTELFDDAVQREHSTLCLAQHIGEALELFDIVQCLAIAEELEALGDRFETRLAEGVRKQRMRVIRTVDYMCPVCRKAHCPQAIPVMVVRIVDDNS